RAHGPKQRNNSCLPPYRWAESADPTTGGRRAHIRPAPPGGSTPAPDPMTRRTTSSYDHDVGEQSRRDRQAAHDIRTRGARYRGGRGIEPDWTAEMTSDD